MAFSCVFQFVILPMVDCYDIFSCCCFADMCFFSITVPGPPDNLAGERVGSAGILLSWSIPRSTNGKIVAYSVIYREVCPWMQSSYTQVATTADSLEVLLTSLTPGTTYEIKVLILKYLM